MVQRMPRVLSNERIKHALADEGEHMKANNFAGIVRPEEMFHRGLKQNKIPLQPGRSVAVRVVGVIH